MKTRRLRRANTAPVTVATYNLLKGGSARAHWLTLIERHGVGLLLVQESYPPAEHLPASRYPDAAGRTVWERVGETGWGSGVYSHTGRVTPVPVPGFSGWVVGAEVTRAGWQAGSRDPLLAFSVHAPAGPGGYHGQMNRILDAIRTAAGGRAVLIGGDFNVSVTDGPGAWRPMTRAERAIQARLADEFGLVNCWAAAHPGEPPAQTLRWTGGRTTPYHCDGLFVPRAWADRLTGCEVLAGGGWDALSDHNPVVARFRPPAAGRA